MPYFFDLVDYYEAPKFVDLKLKYSGALHEFYFSTSHIVHITYPYQLCIVVGSGHFADTIIGKQNFYIAIHQYAFAFLLYYLLFCLLDSEH